MNDCPICGQPMTKHNTQSLGCPSAVPDAEPFPPDAARDQKGGEVGVRIISLQHPYTNYPPCAFCFQPADESACPAMPSHGGSPHKSISKVIAERDDYAERLRTTLYASPPSGTPAGWAAALAVADEMLKLADAIEQEVWQRDLRDWAKRLRGAS